jgi:hypothetical protein
LARYHGDPIRAGEHFFSQLQYLRAIVEVVTVSAHGSAISSAKNIDLIPFINPEDSGLTGDAMYAMDFSTLSYYSDAGRSWDLFRHNINDYPPEFPPDYKAISSIDCLIALIREHRIAGLYLSSHPELWASNGLEDVFLEMKYGRLRFLVKKMLKKFGSPLRKKTD